MRRVTRACLNVIDERRAFRANESKNLERFFTQTRFDDFVVLNLQPEITCSPLEKPHARELRLAIS
jgi:hypothetical protein